jgi:GDP-L-fucose synthase
VKKKILVLGGNGFVGSNVIQKLKDNNYDPISLSKRDGLDLSDLENTKKNFAQVKPDVIINTAALVGSLNYVTQVAAHIFDENMRMLLNLFRAFREVVPGAVLINPIANCAYPGDLNEYSEDKFWFGKVHQSVLAYGSTRRMIDILSEVYNMQYQLRSINFLVPNMYGPFDSTDPNKAHALNALSSKFVKAKKEKLPSMEVWGSGIAIREWLYAGDFGRIIKLTLEDIDSWKFSESFNIGQNFGLSVRELVHIIVKETGYQGEVIWNKKMPDGAPRKIMDDKRFRKVFPDFNFTPLETGIRKTISYYESIYPY